MESDKSYSLLDTVHTALLNDMQPPDVHPTTSNINSNANNNTNTHPLWVSGDTTPPPPSCCECVCVHVTVSIHHLRLAGPFDVECCTNATSIHHVLHLK